MKPSTLLMLAALCLAMGVPALASRELTGYQMTPCQVGPPSTHSTDDLGGTCEQLRASCAPAQHTVCHELQVLPVAPGCWKPPPRPLPSCYYCTRPILATNIIGSCLLVGAPGRRGGGGRHPSRGCPAAACRSNTLAAGLLAVGSGSSPTSGLTPRPAHECRNERAAFAAPPAGEPLCAPPHLQVLQAAQEYPSVPQGPAVRAALR